MYKHLNVTGDIDSIDLDQFRLKRDAKRGAMGFKFYNGDWWASLTKQAGQFFAPKTLRDRFGGVNTMKNFLGIATHPALERSFKAASKLKNELPIDLKMERIPLEELSFDMIFITII